MPEKIKLCLFDPFFEVLVCFGLGCRSLGHISLLFKTIILSLCSFVFWTGVFVWKWPILFPLAQGAAVFILMGAALFFPGSLPGLAAAGPATVSGMASISTSLLAFGFAGSIFAYILIGIVFLLLILMSNRIILEFYLIKKIRVEVLKKYDQSIVTGQSKFIQSAAYSILSFLKFSVLFFLCLSIPVLNGVMLFILINYNLGKSLIAESLEEVSTDPERVLFIKKNRVGLFFLGMGQLFLVAVPFVSMISPIIIGSATCHFSYRSKLREMSN